MDLGVGMKVDSSLGEVIVLDVKKDYLVLFRCEYASFVVANNYEYKNNRLSWASGNYYPNLDSLIKNI